MPAQLNDGCQFAAFKVGAADGFSGRFVDDKHKLQLGRRGNQGEKAAP